MGQPVAVTVLPSSRSGAVRFETNRVLTGMGHERYRRDEPVVGHRPPDRLARRIFDDHAGVRSVHVNASIVTLELDHGADTEAIRETIEDLYTYYREGVEPPVIDTGEA